MRRVFCFLCLLFLILLPVRYVFSEIIKIGVAGPHSGDLASYGIPTKRAVTFVVQEKNNSGGIIGMQIKQINEDDVCKPEIANNIANKLISKGVTSVIGHICSGATKASLGIYKDAGIIVISPSATNVDLTHNKRYPNFFRTIAPDNSQAMLQVDFVINKLNIKKIAVIHDKGDYGKGIAEFAREFIKNSVAELVLFEGVTPGAVDYSAVVHKIKRSGAKAVIFGGYHPEASKIVAQMRRKNMDTAFISDDGVKDETFIRVAGKYAEGVYATGPKDVSRNPLAIKAVNEHKKQFGSEPGAFYLNAYSAALCLLNAIEKAGSADYDAIANTLRSEYVETPIGKISFDKKGDAIGIGISMYKVHKGVFIELND